MADRRLSLGLDYGTNSVRALLVDVETGEEAGSQVVEYPTGEHGVWLDPKNPHLARQNPQDYLDGLFESVSGAVRNAGARPEQVIGIGVDTTGSTPIPVDERGVPLAFSDEHRCDLNAMAWLWKDHTSHDEAAEITALCQKRGEPYLKKCGGVYSSEWFWAKALHCERTAPSVFANAHSWVELCDFIPAYLAGSLTPNKIKRSACAAGHKAMFHSEWGGLPSVEFFAALSPGLAKLRSSLYAEVFASDTIAGHLDPEAADKCGLLPGTPIAVGGFDAHFGAVGSGVKRGVLVKIIGTSTCDIMVAPMDGTIADIPGICGVAEHSVLPGMLGLEAGQSAVGDIFNWFVQQICGDADGAAAHDRFSSEAARLAPGESGLLALDWNNGNRSILTDPRLTGLLLGQTLATSPCEIYRALIEATAFGALRIIERLEEYGVKIDEIVACGGIAEKSPLLMQIYSDVCNRPMQVSASSQTCALGAAIFGAVAGGAHKTVEDAQNAMVRKPEKRYEPNRESHAVYAQLYQLYRGLHDAFGVSGTQLDLSGTMKRLLEIREMSRR